MTNPFDLGTPQTPGYTARNANTTMNDDIEKIVDEYFKVIRPEGEYANGDDGFFSCRARSADWIRQALHQAQQLERERILALRPEEFEHWRTRELEALQRRAAAKSRQ